MKYLKLPSNKKFGFFLSFVFTLLSLFFLMKLKYDLFKVFTLLTILSFIVTVFKSDILAPLNKLWMHFGYFLGIIIRPIILGIIFYIIITPTAVITRLFGRDELKIKMQDCESYWRKRSPIGPDSSSFKHQF